MKALFLLLIGFAAASPAMAQQFRWVDKDGRVQYGDVPPPGVQAKRLRPPPAGPASAPTSAASKDAGKPLSPEAAFRKRQEERAAEEKKASQAAADAELLRQNCAAAQAQLRSIDSGIRISTVNAQGERVYLDEAQIAAERARAQDAVSANCK